MTYITRFVFPIGFALLISFFSCKDENSKLVALDLLPHGLPLKILAPPDSEILFDDMGIVKDMTIIGNENFSIQIFASRTNTTDVKKIVVDLKKTIEESKFFSRMIKVNEDGFIYERKIDENYINYDFRFIKIRGDQQYVFQTGLSGKYTLEEVEGLYMSVQ